MAGPPFSGCTAGTGWSPLLAPAAGACRRKWTLAGRRNTAWKQRSFGGLWCWTPAGRPLPTLPVLAYLGQVGSLAPVRQGAASRATPNAVRSRVPVGVARYGSRYMAEILHVLIKKTPYRHVHIVRLADRQASPSEYQVLGRVR